MLQLINEAGFGGWFVILFTIIGLAATTTGGRGGGRRGSLAAVGGVVVVAAGIGGFGAGQRMPDRPFNGRRGDQTAPASSGEDANRRVSMLSRGSAEAAAN